ncbi:MAG: glycosyltransferase family 4 protein [Candidatus Rokuibacteriota bacterium]
MSETAPAVPRPRHFSIVTETYPPEVNGVARTLGQLVRGLRARGHVVSVIRPRQHAWDGRCARDSDMIDDATTLVRGVPLPRYAGLQMGVPAPGKLRETWTRDRPDAVYVATEGPLGHSAMRMGRRLGVPVVSGVHTNFHRYMRHYRAGALQHVALRYLRHFHGLTDRTLVATAELRDRLEALGFANLAVLGRGVDTRLFTPERRSAALRASWGASTHDLVVLQVGRLAPEKSPALGIEAYRAMAGAGGASRCVMVGEGPLRATLQRANPDVVFTGELTGEPLATHYASADVFVFPSDTETFGNVTLEAMASGLAVVAYDDAAAKVHIAHGVSGVLAPHGDARAFVAEAVALVRSPERLAEMRRLARAATAPLDWRRIVERFESILTGAPKRADDLALRRRETS